MANEDQNPAELELRPKATKRKANKNPQLHPMAGVALVELVNELEKLDQYEQDKKDAAFRSFHNGIPIYLYETIRPDKNIIRRRNEIITKILELTDQDGHRNDL